MDLLKTLVKVGEINNLTDARFCAGMGVQMLGFAMAHKSRKSLTKEEYIAITQWLEGPKFIGEFEEESDDFILGLNKELNFDLIQTSDVNQAKRLADLGLKVILSVSKVESIPPNLSYVIIEETFEGDYQYLANYAELLVAKNITISSLDGLLVDENVSGIHLKGSDEIRPGYKDLDELADILEALEA